ncbi:unnamed protein product, partial [Choristocarpus tenellus]
MGSGVPSKSGDGGWQQGSSSTSLSWLTNLRKGILNKGVLGGGGSGDQSDEDNRHEGSGRVDGMRRKARSTAEPGEGDAVGVERRGGEVAPSSAEARSLLALFEDLSVNPPQDTMLRQHWDNWVQEDVGRHNARWNRQ